MEQRVVDVDDRGRENVSRLMWNGFLASRLPSDVSLCQYKRCGSRVCLLVRPMLISEKGARRCTIASSRRGSRDGSFVVVRVRVTGEVCFGGA
jgi:hypothetical protein